MVFELDACRVKWLCTIGGSLHLLLHPRRYEKMCESTKSFIITQYGLSCFEKLPTSPGERPEYASRTFNFWIFPQVGSPGSPGVYLTQLILPFLLQLPCVLPHLLTTRPSLLLFHSPCPSHHPLPATCVEPPSPG